MPVFSRGDVHVLFVHVPKTGGTALEHCFEDAGFTTTFRDTSPARVGPALVRRCSPQHLHGALLAELVRLEALTASFMVVRHPDDRFRSEFAFRRGRGLDAPPRPAAVERWGLRKLERSVEDPYLHDNHFRPQWEFAVPGVSVFRYEDGLDAVVEALNREHALDLPAVRRHNARRAGGRPSAEVPLTPRLREALRDRYAGDFTQFAYDRS